MGGCGAAAAAAVLAGGSRTAEAHFPQPVLRFRFALCSHVSLYLVVTLEFMTPFFFLLEIVGDDSAFPARISASGLHY